MATEAETGRHMLSKAHGTETRCHMLPEDAHGAICPWNGVFCIFCPISSKCHIWPNLASARKVLGKCSEFGFWQHFFRQILGSKLKELLVFHYTRSPAQEPARQDLMHESDDFANVRNCSELLGISSEFKLQNSRFFVFSIVVPYFL